MNHSPQPAASSPQITLHDYIVYVDGERAPRVHNLGLHKLQQSQALAGELLEFLTADSREHILEELGDIEFYFTGLTISYGVTRHEIQAARSEIPAVYRLLQAAKFVVNGVKRDIIYQELCHHVPMHLTHFDSALLAVEAYYGFERNVVLTVNREKRYLREST